MVLIEKDDSNYYSGDGFSGWDYPIKDENINFAVIKVDGRSPKKGYQVNTGCKEMLYILRGTGTLYLKENTKTVDFKEGDVILLDRNECYAFDGDFKAAVPCVPAWTSEQHLYVD